MKKIEKLKNELATLKAIIGGQIEVIEAKNEIIDAQDRTILMLDNCISNMKIKELHKFIKSVAKSFSFDAK
ncbi:MAG: hypothetical protein U9N33_08215 [Campylobacterota bacterium]|nr:hypothetical protein [Campylobacterota bacterium]